MGNRQVLDKTDKMDSNWRRTIYISPVQSVTGFEHVQKCLTDFPNVNGHKTDTPNRKQIENGH